MADKLGKVFPGSLSDQTIPGDNHRLKEREVFSSPEENRGHRKSNRTPTLGAQDFSKEGNVPPGTPYSNIPGSYVGTGELPTVAATDLAVLGQTERQSGQGFLLIPKHAGLSNLVARQGKPIGRQTLEARVPKSSYDRRQRNRLGSALGRSCLPGTVGTRNSRKILQLQRVIHRSSGIAGSKTGPGKISRPDSVGQCYNSSLHQQTGRYKKPGIDEFNFQDFFLSGRKLPVSLCGFSKGKTQPAGRFPEQANPTPGGMEPEQGNFQEGLRTLGGARNRPVFLQKEPPGQSILFPKPGRPTMGSGRLLGAVEMEAGICFPPNLPHSKGPKKDSGGSGQNNSSCPILAKKGLVFSPEGSVCHRPMGPAGTGGPSSTGSNIPSTSRKSTPNCMDVERDMLKAKGFSNPVISTMLSSRKEVTHKIYYKVWKTFQAFCGPSQVDIDSCNVSKVLDFLQAGLDKGLRPATLKVHISALSSFFSRPLASDPWIVRFMRGAERILPTAKIRTPPWDLSLVLAELTKPPFEPLKDAPIKFLTLKTAFLVAITSARRIGELSALVTSPPYTRILEDRIILRPDPAFLPKVVSSFHRDQEIILPSFCEGASSSGERTFHSLDVRRAVIEYLDASKGWRKSGSLFLQFSGIGKGEKASKSSIARWIKQVIQLAYSSAGVPIPAQLKAHSTRAMAASWAERQAASVEQICKAATWSSPNTFFRHYRLNVSDPSDLSFGRKVLQAIIPP